MTNCTDLHLLGPIIVGCVFGYMSEWWKSTKHFLTFNPGPRGNFYMLPPLGRISVGEGSLVGHLLHRFFVKLTTTHESVSLSEWDR